MEFGYLIDTNAVIDYLGNKLPSQGASFLDNLIPSVSVITRIEILGWFQITSFQLTSLSAFIDNATVYPLDEKIIVKTIELRQQFRIKTPDAIIAATAIVNNRILVTHNAKDFNRISELNVVDPYDV